MAQVVISHICECQYDTSVKEAGCQGNQREQTDAEMFEPFVSHKTNWTQTSLTRVHRTDTF